MKTYNVAIVMQLEGDDNDIKDIKEFVSNMTNGDPLKSKVEVNEMEYVYTKDNEPIMLIPVTEVARVKQANADAIKAAAAAAKMKEIQG